MKKTLSIILVSIMLLCMIPVFGIFADEAADVTTIATAEEYLAFVASVNSGTFTGKQVEVTADIDLTDKEYVPINSLNGVVIDFKGHTLSGINYTNEAPESSDSE